MGFLEKLLGKKEEDRKQDSLPKEVESQSNHNEDVLKYHEEIQAATPRADKDFKNALENKAPLLITPPEILKNASEKFVRKYFNDYWMNIAVQLMLKDNQWRDLGLELKKKLELAEMKKDRADVSDLHEKLNELLQKGDSA